MFENRFEACFTVFGSQTSPPNRDPKQVGKQVQTCFGKQVQTETETETETENMLENRFGNRFENRFDACLTVFGSRTSPPNRDPEQVRGTGLRVEGWLGWLGPGPKWQGYPFGLAFLTQNSAWRTRFRG